MRDIKAILEDIEIIRKWKLKRKQRKHHEN